MHKKLPIDTTKENAQELLKKINLEAEAEIADINAITKREVDKIFAQANKEVEAKKEIDLSQLQKEIEALREKNFSTVTLEKKRVILGEQNAFIEKVFCAVKDEAARFRLCAEYVAFLERAILEAVAVIDSEHMVVSYSSLDEKIFSAEFITNVQKNCAVKFGKKIVFNFQKSDFNDMGVTAASCDGHLCYDNRFTARLKRAYEEIYAQLQKEIA
ncbi:MAG: V-type ATP synthase subunit E family protein [Candidatus Omnitrophota bacterium]